MSERVSFKNPPDEADPYRDIDPKVSYEFSKLLVELGVETEEILDQYEVVEVPEETA
jgi:hypothetical protein